jgi:membrane protease YdiL (CAAX protease family)
MKNEQVHDEERFSLQIAWLAIIFVFLLYIAWIGAWLFEQILEINFNYMATSQGQFVYWLVMKLILWVLPSIVIIRYSGRKCVEVMSIKRFQSILVWGCGFGLMLGAITIGIKALEHQPLFLFENTLSFISGVIIAPIVEEVTFRGAVLG